MSREGGPSRLGPCSRIPRHGDWAVIVSAFHGGQHGSEGWWISSGRVDDGVGPIPGIAVRQRPRRGRHRLNRAINQPRGVLVWEVGTCVGQHAAGVRISAAVQAFEQAHKLSFRSVVDPEANAPPRVVLERLERFLHELACCIGFVYVAAGLLAGTGGERCHGQTGKTLGHSLGHLIGVDVLQVRQCELRELVVECGMGGDKLVENGGLFPRPEKIKRCGQGPSTDAPRCFCPWPRCEACHRSATSPMKSAALAPTCLSTIRLQLTPYPGTDCTLRRPPWGFGP